MDSTTNSSQREVAHEIVPYLVEYTDGTVERKLGTQQVPPGFDPLTSVTSKDTILVQQTGLSARLYRPTATVNEKLPVVVYFHGGAFVVVSPAEPHFHRFCNTLTGSAKALVVSVDYRLAPEHPLPTAFDDAWAAIEWIATHFEGAGPDSWLNEGADFERIFLAGDSAGATVAHHSICRVGLSHRVKIQGVAILHPYFWGKDPIGIERVDPVRKALVDKWWLYVCPSDKGCDDPLINPFADGAPSLDRVACERMIVMVAEKDILRDRGRLYYESMVLARNIKKVECLETPGEDHAFYLVNPHCEKANELVKYLVSFINAKEIDNSAV